MVLLEGAYMAIMGAMMHSDLPHVHIVVFCRRCKQE
jgi:hypothetical protein